MSVANTVKRSLDERRSSSALLVLGMHRSGTSAITGALGLCGAWVGEETELTGANAENPRGFWERRDMRQICDRLLQAAGADWWKVASFDPKAIPHAILAEERRRFEKIIAALDEHGTWVVKEPRLCLLLPLLRDHIDNPVCIHISRNPLEVAQSLQSRNGFSIAAGLALWEAYNRLALSASENLPRLLVSHESLMLRPMETVTEILEQLAELRVMGLAEPIGARINDFINPSLYRKRVAEEKANDFLSASQRTLWRHLCSGQVFDEEGSISIPRVTRQHLFDLESTERSLNQYIDRANALSSEISTRDRAVRELESRTATLTSVLRNQQATIAAREKAIKVHEATIAAREATIEARDAAIRALLESTSWGITAPLRVFSRGARSFRNKLVRTLRLMFRPTTFQILSAIGATLPYYRRYVPRFVHEAIPRRLRDFAVRQILHPERPVTTNIHGLQVATIPPISTYVVSGVWLNRYPQAARSILRSGQALIVMGRGYVASGENVTAVSGNQARTLALAAVATGTAIEVGEYADPDATSWSSWREPAENQEVRTDRGVRLLTSSELVRELEAAGGEVML